MSNRKDRRASKAAGRPRTSGGSDPLAHAGRAGRPPRPTRTPRDPGPPPIDDLVRIVVAGGRELLDIDDPLEAEQWASAMLGTFYKMSVPWDVREMVDRELGPSIARLAEARGDAGARAALEAIAAVGDRTHAEPARAAADRMAARGIPAPAWAAEIGAVEIVGTWAVLDVFGDQEGYYAAFTYPGRRPHLLSMLVDKALGEIVKDAGVGYLKGDPVEILADAADRESGTSVTVADPAVVARRVLDAIASGDMYLDNDWTDDFKHTRALAVTRMRRLPLGPELERPELDDDARLAIIDAFLAVVGAAPDSQDAHLASICLGYTCDYLGEDPYRWSPIVVEQFLLDFLPRKVSLSLGDVRALPRVLRSWVRFALARRGLEERWIAETEEAVDQFAQEFAATATDPSNFGPAKEVMAEMLADGVDMDDPQALAAWIAEYNKRQ